MKAIICDRCGKQIKECIYANELGKEMSVIMINKSRSYDLCIDCSKGLDTWLDRYSRIEEDPVISSEK